MQVPIRTVNEVIDLWKSSLLNTDEARALLPIPTTATVCEDEPGPCYAAGEYVAGDDYSELPVGTLLATSSEGTALKVPGNRWYFSFDGNTIDSGLLASSRKILFIPQG